MNDNREKVESKSAFHFYISRAEDSTRIPGNLIIVDEKANMFKEAIV